MSSGSAVATLKAQLPAFAIDEEKLMAVLRSSLYPGAKDESIKMVIGYCQASGLDPMQKPVHIVPMSVKVKVPVQGKAGVFKDEYQERDVIMPGIGLYRVQAARSGEYGGISEPEFGPEKEFKFEEEVWTGSGENRSASKKAASIMYPEWCRVTVKRIVGDRLVEFTAVEYWLENYATQSRYTTAPNAMWKKRPRGQIVKCTEAQALRKAFPEIGAQPTADELEGKVIEDVSTVIDSTATRIPEPERKSAATKKDAKNEKAPATEQKPAAAEGAGAGAGGDESGALLTDSMKKTIHARMAGANVTDEQIAKQFGKKVDELPASKANDVLAWIREMAEASQ